MVRPHPSSGSSVDPVGKAGRGASDEDAAASGVSGVRSVQRSLDILSLLTEQRPVITIREIVAATGLAKTTVLRLAQTLEHAGLLWATEAGYMAGPGLWRWAHLARNAWELPPETRRMMSDLAQRHEETVNLYIRHDVSRLCIAQAESPRALRHVVNVGDDLPLWAGASAKVLLAGCADAVLARVASSAPTGDVDLAQLRAEVARVQERGWAVSHGERESGVSAVAVPVANPAGAVVAALSLSGATARFDDERVEQFATALRAASLEMSGRGFVNAFAASAFTPAGQA